MYTVFDMLNQLNCYLNVVVLKNIVYYLNFYITTGGSKIDAEDSFESG